MTTEHLTVKQRLENVFKKIKENRATIFKSSLPYFIGVSIGVTTFFISAYMNSDDIRIESVIVGPKELYVSVDRNFARTLQEYANTETDNSSLITSMDNHYLLNVFNGLYNVSIEGGEQLKLLKEQKNQLDIIPGDTIQVKELYKKAGLYSYFLYYDDDQYVRLDETKASINRDITAQTKKIEAADSCLRRLVTLTKKALKGNDDKFQIQVMAFNSGNQQTVLRYKGKIKLGANELNMVKVNNEKVEDYYSKLASAISASTRGDASSNYIVVPAKSYVILALEVDGKFSNTPRDIQFINREYFSGASDANITLYNIQNEPIRPFQFRLRSDVEYNPNNKVIEFIDKNLGAFDSDAAE